MLQIQDPIESNARKKTNKTMKQQKTLKQSAGKK